MSEAKQIIERANAARSERRRFEPMFDDAMRLTMPGRRRFTDEIVNETGDDIFDETGVNAVQEFVSRMQAGLIPPFTRFVKLEAGELVDPKDRLAVNRDLEEIEKYLFEEIWSSNFAQESAEALNDMAISTGTLLVEEGQDGAFVHRAVPLTELDFEKGADDGVGGQFRRRKIKAKLIEASYPRGDFDKAVRTKGDAEREGDKTLGVIETTFRDWNSPAPRWRHMVVVEDHEEVLIDRVLEGVGANPFLSFRWMTTAGEVWGRGPALNAMAAIRTTNLMIELILENAAMSIVGIYQTDNEATINADQVSLLPGTILSKEIGTAGLEPIAGNTGNFNMQELVLNDQRLNIKRALFNDMLSDPNKTPATATEVVERMADLANRTASGFARIFFEFIVPYIRRTLYILEKRRDIELPVRNGRALQFRATSPIAQAQSARQVQALVQDHAVRAQLFGPQAASASYNTDHLHRWLIENIGLDERLYVSAKDLIEAVAQQAEAAAMMQQQMAMMKGGTR